MAFRFNVTMNDDLPSGLVNIYTRGAIVNGAQSAVNTVTVHDTHDIQVGDKFLYALSRTNILTDRVFTVTARTATTITFSGGVFSFTDKNHLVPLGVDTGGVLQADGTYSALNWDGSTVSVGKDPNLDSLYDDAEVPVEPGGELGFWSDIEDLWGISRFTGGKPVRIYILGVPTVATSAVLGPPLSLPRTPRVWWKADTITGVANGANVTENWVDQSGNNHHGQPGGVTGNNLADAVRPKWFAATNAAEVTGGKLRSLPCVSLEGSTAGGGGFGVVGFFTIAGGPLVLPSTAGWTACFIIRDFTDIAQSNYFLGPDTGLGDDGDDYVRMTGGGAVSTSWIAQEAASPKAFSNAYGHVQGNASEAVVLRCEAGTGVIRSWLNGALQISTGNGGAPHIRPSTETFRYLGRSNISGTSAGVYGKAVAEFILFDVGLPDAEIANINDYLLERMAGSVTVLTPPAFISNVGTWPNPTATSGTDTACTNGTVYHGAVFLPMSASINGIWYLVGSVGGTDSVIVSLYSANGTLLATSVTSGTTVGTLNQGHAVNFISPYAATGPAWYYIGVKFNGATAKFRTVPAHCQVGSGAAGGSVAQAFGTQASIVPAAGFFADLVPIASFH
jgi:hypothetical protein